MNTKKNTDKTVVVIGAGIVGLSCALWLQKTGWSVVLVDGNTPGSGTSYGNACTIADYACSPINNAKVLQQLPSLLFSKHSPLSVSPWHALQELPWFWRFLRHCSASRVQEIKEALAVILSHAYSGLLPLLELSKTQHLIHQQGCMYAYSTPQAFANECQNNRIRQAHGIAFRELSAHEVKDLEPQLKQTFVGGLLFENASHVLSPKALCEAYFQCFKEMGGVYVASHALALQQQAEQVSVQLKNTSILDAGAVVVAAGAFSTQIGGLGGCKLPLYTERGYHVQYTGHQGVLSRPVCWSEQGFYATPMEEGLRIAGTVEFAGYSSRINPRSVRYLTEQSKRMLALEQEPDQHWLGFRPTLPDALPAIGFSPSSKRVLYAFGHQHLGLTLAGITGKVIAELMAHEPSRLALNAYDPARFG